MKYILKRSATEYRQSSCGRNWIIKITAEAGDSDTDPNVFVFQTAEAGDPISTDLFQTVSTVALMNDTPIGGPSTIPGTQLQTPFYRLPFVQLDFYTPEEAAEFWDKVRARVEALVRNLQAESRLRVEETVEIG